VRYGEFTTEKVVKIIYSTQVILCAVRGPAIKQIYTVYKPISERNNPQPLDAYLLTTVSCQQENIILVRNT
jgi:hypothetical protein